MNEEKLKFIRKVKSMVSDIEIKLAALVDFLKEERDSI